MGKGDLLIYNNCYSESDKRNENMKKNYAPEKDNGVESVSDSSMCLFNIYVRERSKTTNGVLKIKNGIIFI